MLNPQMPDKELLHHMGDLTTDEMLVARSAIEWANAVYGRDVTKEAIADANRRESTLTKSEY